MEQWLADFALEETRLFLSNLDSSVHEDGLAHTATVLGLLRGSSTLWTRADQDDHLKLTIGSTGDDEQLLQHEDYLLPYWTRFVQALSLVTFSKHTYISFSIHQVQLSNQVMNMIVQSLKKSPLDWLFLRNNGLGEDGYNWLVDLVSTNTSLETLYIKSNPIESEDVATKLINVVDDHPKLDIILLENCGIGQKDAVMKAILPLLHLKEVSLNGNHIGSYGAELISDHLAKNPVALHKLLLRDNLLNDTDAKKLSVSLQTNTNLKVLSLTGNLITRDGMVSFLWVVCNVNSLNAMSDSNHSCLVKIDDNEDSFLSNFFNEVNNTSIDPAYNRQVKIFKALVREPINMTYLKDTPIEVMPRLLVLLHDTAFYKLNALFRFMKEWNMPLLYTSRLGKEPRRSKRIRKKMVMKYMGKK